MLESLMYNICWQLVAKLEITVCWFPSNPCKSKSIIIKNIPIVIQHIRNTSNGLFKVRTKWLQVDAEAFGSYQAALQDLRPLQSYCDAVEEDEGQDHIVEELMGNDGLAEQPEPDETDVRGRG